MLKTILFKVFLALTGALLMDLIVGAGSIGEFDFAIGYLFSIGIIISGCIIYELIYWVNKILYPDISIGDWVEIDSDPLVKEEDDPNNKSIAYKVMFIGSNKIAHLFSPETGKEIFLKTFRLLKLPDVEQGSWTYNWKIKRFFYVDSGFLTDKYRSLGHLPFLRCTDKQGMKYLFQTSDELETFRPACFYEILEHDLK